MRGLACCGANPPSHQQRREGEGSERLALLYVLHTSLLLFSYHTREGRLVVVLPATHTPARGSHQPSYFERWSPSNRSPYDLGSAY
jgi:hypothetical protein